MTPDSKKKGGFGDFLSRKKEHLDGKNPFKHKRKKRIVPRKDKHGFY